MSTPIPPATPATQVIIDHYQASIRAVAQRNGSTAWPTESILAILAQVAISVQEGRPVSYL